MYKLGLIPSPPDDRDYPVSAFLPVESKFEPSFDLPDFDKIPVYDQEDISDCYAFAMRTAREYVEMRQTGVYVPLSQGAVYGNRVEGDYMGPGLIPRVTNKRVLDRGIPKLSIFPENIEVPGAVDLYNKRFVDIIVDGKPRRFTAYALARSNDEIKSCLRVGFPVLIGIPVYKDFYYLNQQNSIVNSHPVGDPEGDHGMVLRGWNDNIGAVGCYRDRNSWGLGWGDKGECWIPYDYPIREAWLIVDELTPITKSRRYDRTIKKIVVHHMGDGKGTDVSITSRWNPYGYEYPEYDIGIEGNGRVIQGRPLNVIGSHAVATYQKYLIGEYYDASGEDNWWNKNSLGIGLAGDFTEVSMPEVMFNSLVAETKRQMKIHGLTPTDVLPHKEITSTACPGTSWSWNKFIQEISKGDESQVDYGILIFYTGDEFEAVRRFVPKLGYCPIFLRNAEDKSMPKCALAVKKLYVVGGDGTSVGHPNEEHIPGADYWETLANVGKKVKSL